MTKKANKELVEELVIAALNMLDGADLTAWQRYRAEQVYDLANELENGEEDDPTPWCNGCGAMRESDCHCGPLAQNE